MTNKEIKILKKRSKNDLDNDNKIINKSINFITPLILMLPAILFFLVFTIIPLFKVIIDSFSDIGNISGGYGNYYESVWTDTNWYRSIFNSISYALIVIPISLMISLAISYSVTKVVNNKLRGIWQTIFFIPYVTSIIAISLTFRTIMSSQSYGILNWIFNIDVNWLTTPFGDSIIGLFAISIYGIWSSLPFQILILTTAMFLIDKRLYDASAIDGVSRRHEFFKITLPSIEKTIWYLVTIGIIGAVKVFPIGLFNGNSKDIMEYSPTMLAYIYSLISGGTLSYGKAGAASISLIFVVIVFNFLVKFTIKKIQKLITFIKKYRFDRDIALYKKRVMEEKSYDFNDFINKQKHLIENVDKFNGGKHE